jgi:2-C-methyl-D-erythritol 4-phosphate cytidylyltransferase
MNRAIVIVAGGSGTRMGHEIPKQFIPLAGKPILMHTIEAMHRFDPAMQLVVVLPESQMDYWQQLCNDHLFSIHHHLTHGGETRYHSVKNGLAMVTGNPLTGIHDGVRPFVSQQTLKLCFETAQQKGNAIPVVDAVESIRELTTNGNRAVDRTTFKLVQTPQVFKWEQLMAGYALPYSPLFTDDASVVEAAGFTIHLANGNRENIKITTPFDLLVGETLVNKHFEKI